MHVVLLALLTLGVQLAHSDYPIVTVLSREANCSPQNWEGYPRADQWEDGSAYKHLGFDVSEKQKKTKIADFDIKLEGKQGKDAAILCEITAEGMAIEALWLSRFGDEATESFVFGLGKGVTDKVRIGMRGNVEGKTTLNTRVEIYGSGKLKTKVTDVVKCGTGNEGKDCPDGLSMRPRNQLDC